MGSSSALDIGCGTGTLLHRARKSGHSGRLCGIDPDIAMLDRARRHLGIEWIESSAASMPFHGEFDLAVMNGHAFQCLVTDEELRTSLETIHHALVSGGRFAFETRNLLVQPWKNWIPENATKVVDSSGRSIRVSHFVESVEGDVVTFTETTSNFDGQILRVDRASLRFLERDSLTGLLSETGFEI